MNIAPGVRERWDSIPADKRGYVLSCLTNSEKVETLLVLAMEDRIREVMIPPLVEHAKEIMTLLLEDRTKRLATLEDWLNELKAPDDKIAALKAVPPIVQDAITADLRSLDSEWMRLRIRVKLLKELLDKEDWAGKLLARCLEDHGAARKLWGKSLLSASLVQDLPGWWVATFESQEQGSKPQDRLSVALETDEKLEILRRLLETELEIASENMEKLRRRGSISAKESKKGKVAEDDSASRKTAEKSESRSGYFFLEDQAKIRKDPKGQKQRTPKESEPKTKEPQEESLDDWAESLIRTMPQKDWLKWLRTMSPEDQARMQRWREERSHE